MSSRTAICANPGVSERLKRRASERTSNDQRAEERTKKQARDEERQETKD